MERQKSILSFFHKPTAETQSSGGASPYYHALHRRFPVKQEPHTLKDDRSKDPYPEVTGTDTPPAKLGRSIFPAGVPASEDVGHRTAQPFSSIMHEFVRDDGSESIDKRNQDENCSSSPQHKSDKHDTRHVDVKSETTSHDCSNTYFSMFDDEYNGGIPPHFELNSDISGLETPANRPLVPRLKRIQEDLRHADVKDSLLLGSSKRPKSFQDFVMKEETQEELHESATSKFEWLNPSSIRDANGRQPNDPLYDKRTLYIPPDALKKLPASQK